MPALEISHQCETQSCSIGDGSAEYQFWQLLATHKVKVFGSLARFLAAYRIGDEEAPLLLCCQALIPARMAVDLNHRAPFFSVGTLYISRYAIASDFSCQSRSEVSVMAIQDINQSWDCDDSIQRSVKRFWLAAALLLGLSVSAIAGTWSNITEYPVRLSSPQGITAGPDGALWFTEAVGQIGRITTSGVITQYSVPTYDSGPQGITAGPDGALWFTEQFGNKIGRISTAGIVTEYPVPTAGCQPFGIAAGPDGALWFTEAFGDKIGSITTAGVIVEHLVPTAGSQPYGIAAGPDGALWFTEQSGNKIGRITTAGTITEYPVPTANSYPFGITAGPDRALWFTENGKIGRIASGGGIAEYAVSSPFSSLPGIVAGPDGALWFTEWKGSKIWRITTAGVATQYPVSTERSQPYGIAAGPDGALWFTELHGNKIARAPACGLGFSASLAGGALNMNFNLGTDTPATFNIVLLDSTGPFALPFSMAVPAVVPPRAFTMNWSPFPDLGTVTVMPDLVRAPGQGLCAEWTTVNTAQ
jgi:virginiamycin B lyase